MAVTTQILKAQPTGLELLGQGLGTGLGAGLQELAQAKLNQVQQRNLASQLQQLNVPQEKATALSQLSPELQQLYIKDILAAPTQQTYAQELAKIVSPQEQPTTGIETNPRKIPSAPRLTERQATQLAKIQQQEKHFTAKERAEAFKQTKAERKEILDKTKAARQNLHDLNRIEELEKEGKLDTAGYTEFLKESGFDIPALQSEGSEEFNKIAASFIKDAKSYFGSRISNFELESFLKTIPSLSQSPEGRKRVVANLKYMNRAALEYNNALKEVLAENEGIPPLDLSQKIDDKIEGKLDKISEKFKEDLKKPVPARQNRLVTAAQKGIGKLVGAPGRLLNAAGHLLGAGVTGAL